MAKSPAVILYDSNGVAMAVEDGVAIPVGTQALLAAGSDGTDAHFILTNSAGSPVVVGSGVAGTPAGGVLSVQGVAGGTAIPISGTVSATNPSVSTNNSAAPGSSTQIGGSDGTNLQAARIFDADTGGGTQYVLGAILRKAASGGSVEAGTSSDPLRVDPTGTTTQPISAASLPLPTGAATEATLSTRLADATFTARINTLGQNTMANSTPVVLSSDQSAVPVTDNSGSLTVDTTQLPAALVGGRLDENIGAWLGSTAPTVGSKTSANSVPVVIASDQSAVAISAASLPLPTGAATSANQTTLGNQTTKINDGTNTAAVKAASTAAVATDPALVVAISPNNTITTSNASVGSNNAAIPASSTQVGGSDGTNLQAVRVFDGDTGGGTQYVLGAILRKSASGGSVEAGTSSDPLRVDPTGTTAQPVTDNGGSLTVDTTQLPGALVGGRLDINNGAWLGSTAPTVGQKTMANSVPTVIASDQTALPVNVVGAHANLWNNAATGTNGNSTAIDTQYTPHITVFGNTSNSTTMSIQASQDNTNFYTIGTFSAPAGDFGSSFTCGARYIRLQSSNNRTVTATLAGKD